MSECVDRSPYFRNLSLEVLEEHSDIQWIPRADIKVDFLTSDKARKKGAKAVLAECIKVKEVYKPYCEYDFLIVVYLPNVDGMSKEQLKILLYHEFLHIGISEDGEEVKYVINPHDIEDFRKIVCRYGIDWAEH